MMGFAFVSWYCSHASSMYLILCWFFLEVHNVLEVCCAWCILECALKLCFVLEVWCECCVFHGLCVLHVVFMVYTSYVLCIYVICFECFMSCELWIFVFYSSICSFLVVFMDASEKPNGRWNKGGIA